MQQHINYQDCIDNSDMQSKKDLPLTVVECSPVSNDRTDRRLGNREFRAVHTWSD